MKTLQIVWQRLVYAGETCPRCAGTGDEVERAVQTLRAQLMPLGIEPVLETRAIDDAAFKANPSESNRVWIAGKPMEEWVSAKVGSSPCCSVCGDNECRTVEVAGASYEVVPEDLLVKAGLIAALTINAQPAASASMKSSIEPTEDGLRITAAVPKDQQQAMLAAFEKCAAGTCSCPTPQYEKMASINVTAGDEGVTVDLKVKPGEQVDMADIQKCLDHTSQQLER